jgi:hypothetical protein
MQAVPFLEQLLFAFLVAGIRRANVPRVDGVLHPNAIHLFATLLVTLKACGVNFLDCTPLTSWCIAIFVVS